MVECSRYSIPPRSELVGWWGGNRPLSLLAVAAKLNNGATCSRIAENIFSILYMHLDSHVSTRLSSIWQASHYKAFTQRQPMAPLFIKPNSLLFLGINPSYTAEHDPKEVTNQLIFYNLHGEEKLHTHFKALQDFTAQVNEHNTLPVEWTHLDMLYMRETDQAQVNTVAYSEAGASFVMEQVEVTGNLLKQAKPRVLVVANRMAAVLLGHHKELNKKTQRIEHEWLNWHFYFDEQLGTYRCPELNGCPVFFTKPFSGLGKMQHTPEERKRLAWHIRHVLRLTT